MFHRLSTALTERYLNLTRRALHWRSLFVSLFGQAPQRIVPKEESRHSHAGTVADLFATIMSLVDGMEWEDMNTAMDILRYDFPNVEHIWLQERFQKAYMAKYPLEPTLMLAAANRTEAERVSLALEIFTMLNRVGGDLSNPDLFARVTAGLHLPEVASTLEQLVSTPGMEASRPIECVSFSSKKGEGNITLSPKDAGIRFRALRCVNILIIVNDSRTPLSVRGFFLHQGDMLPLSDGQGVSLPSGYVSYKSIRFFLQAHYSGLKVINYIQQQGDGIAVTRQRTLNSMARVLFGENVEIEMLRKDTPFRLDGLPMPYGERIATTYYTPFTIQDQGPYFFADIYGGDATGHSFLLSPESRRVLVTNLPYMNKPGALMLQPGLAPGVVFEVSYSRSSNTGMLRVLEAPSHTLTVEGVPVRGDTPLRDGSLIGLSSVQYLRCRFSADVLEEESSSITSLRVRGLTRDFVRAGRVLDNVDFELNRGDMACIMGPSGSGKSTLLNILAGHLEASFGYVYYNDEKLTPQNTDLRRHIAFIPREDILEESMTVGEHVYQASLARRPRLNHADRMRRVMAVLNFVGIGHLSARPVGRAGERTISDGERTRLNLSLDLTGTAEVFLVDEPISGLSSSDAERVIQTLEAISSGHVLLCTLHRPAPAILNRFKYVMLLDSHGKMAFWGTPQEMMRYFQDAARELELHISRDAAKAGGADYVFEVLEAPFRTVVSRAEISPSMWQERYESYAYRRKVAQGLSRNGKKESEAPVAEMAIPAPESRWKLLWHKIGHCFPLSLLTWLLRFVLQHPAAPYSSPAQEESPALSRENGEPFKSIPEMPPRTPIELWRLFMLWVSRTFLSRIRSRMGLYALLLEGPVLALLIAGTLKAADDTPYTFYKSLHINEYLFLSLVLAMFFGLTDSACEILRDRPILRRESNYKLFISGYLLAKVLVLTFIASLQCALYLLVGNWILEIHQMFWSHFWVMALTSFIGITLSLMVSAMVRSDRTAMNIVPLLLVPQILLAGAMIRFEEMNEFNPSIPSGYLPDLITDRLSNLRHRVAYQDETTHNITSKPVPLIAEFCPLRYAFEMMFVVQTSDNLWELENARINQKREYLKEHGSEDELRFIQRAALTLNSTASNATEARDILRRVRKAALNHDEAFLEELAQHQDKLQDRPNRQPLEFFFSNRKMATVGEGVKTARKDARLNERRGFFLSPRQAFPLGGIDQETDAGSVSTITRNAIYLILMGLVPVFIAARYLRRI